MGIPVCVVVAVAILAARIPAARAQDAPPSPQEATPSGADAKCAVVPAGPDLAPRTGALEGFGADPLETRFRALGRDVRLRFGGRVAADLARYASTNRKRSGLVPEALEPRLDAWSGALRARIALDLDGTDTPRNLREAYVEAAPTSAFRLRAGQVRIGLGTEAATEDEDLPLPGRNFNAHLDGRHDLALQADVETASGALFAQATLAAGRGFGLEGRRVESPMAAIRVAARPFAAVRSRALRDALGGFFVGGARAELGDFDAPVVLATPSESIVFTTPDLDGRGGSWTRLEFGIVEGPVAFGWERTFGEASGVPVGGGRRRDMDELTAWSAMLAVRLTGEDARWERGAWRDPAPGPAGSVTAAVRYSNGDIDRDLFQEGVTTYDPSSQETRTFTAGLGWKPVEGVRVSAAWVRTLADHELSTFRRRARDTAFLLRLEVWF